MKRSSERLQWLIQNYFSGTITDREEKELWNHISGLTSEKEISHFLPDAYQHDAEVPDDQLKAIHKQHILNTIFAHQPIVSRYARLWPSIAIAAATIAVFFIAGLLYRFNDQDALALSDHIETGKSGATLTLANGKKIVLSGGVSGQLARQANVMISKGADGTLIYTVDQSNDEHSNTQNQAVSNTLSTAMGETYKIILPDHSEVWLNAGSSLKYPARFEIKNEAPRVVELSGEAYFQITKDRLHPFIVKTAAQEVRVLGTHFNISAYREDKRTVTTLAEGSISVKNLKERNQKDPGILLKPDEQSILSDDRILIKKVDAGDALAWKEGYFMFNSEALGSIMNRIGRWYNINIVFEDESLKSRTFFGSISRYEKISTVLNVLKRTGVATFIINGNTVVVKKKQTK